MRSPEFTPLEDLEEINDPLMDHYDNVPKIARTAHHHKELGSQRRPEHQLPELNDKTDLELMTPDRLIKSLKSRLDFAVSVSKLNPEQLAAEIKKDPIFRFRYEGIAEADKDILYITDVVESGEYPTTNEQRDHIYELLALLKDVASRLGFKIAETYTTQTLAEAEQEKLKAEAA